MSKTEQFHVFKNHFYFLFCELSVHHLCSYVLIVDLSLFGWQGALYVLEIPFLDMSFRLNLSHNVAYGVYHACHEKKRSHTVM